jgi:hypothetical protein
MIRYQIWCTAFRADLFSGGMEGFLREVFGEADVAGEADDAGDDAAGLDAPGGFDGAV